MTVSGKDPNEGSPNWGKPAKVEPKPPDTMPVQPYEPTPEEEKPLTSIGWQPSNAPRPAYVDKLLKDDEIGSTVFGPMAGSPPPLATGGAWLWVDAVTLKRLWKSAYGEPK